jgi:hypothetical protein
MHPFFFFFYLYIYIFIISRPKGLDDYNLQVVIHFIFISTINLFFSSFMLEDRDLSKKLGCYSNDGVLTRLITKVALHEASKE